MPHVTLSHAPTGCEDGQEPLAGFTARCLQIGSQLSWPAPASNHLLVLVVATDMRADCLMTLRTSTGSEKGADTNTAAELTCDASFASHAQRFHLAIPAGTTSATVTDISGDGQCWIVSEGPLRPQLFPIDTTPAQRLAQSEHSLRQAAICQFSWMGGCVLDGLNALAHTPGAQQVSVNAWQTAKEQWLSHFVNHDQLHYQLPYGEPADNVFYNIEATLPVAVIAADNPRHPICDYALAMWETKTKDDGAIHDGKITAEASYTTAYPMAVIAVGRSDAALRERALLQLRLRRQRLVVGDDIYLRHGDSHTFKNWARGLTWYLLGLARTLTVLGRDSDPELAFHLQERCRWILGFQRPDGLWNNFLDESGYPPDSSGSAGIATALVLAHDLGLADEHAIAAARRTRTALQDLIQADGFIASVAPNNKRGEKEQHTHRRTIEPFALGLYAQLVAALNNEKGSMT